MSQCLMSRPAALAQHVEPAPGFRVREGVIYADTSSSIAGRSAVCLRRSTDSARAQSSPDHPASSRTPTSSRAPATTSITSLPSARANGIHWARPCPPPARATSRHCPVRSRAESAASARHGRSCPADSRLRTCRRIAPSARGR